MPTAQPTIRVTELARLRDAAYAQGQYDHDQQLMVGIEGEPFVTSTKDEDAGSSTTFWDGESS